MPKVNALARAVAAVLMLCSFAWSTPSPAKSTSEYKVELDKSFQDMRAAWGEIDRFPVRAYYCLPPYEPNKEADIGQFMSLWARADALNGQYLKLKTSLKSFLAGNPRLAAELMLNNRLTPLDDQWWVRYDTNARTMMQARNAKLSALQNAPVRDCTPRATQAPQATPVFDPPPLPQRPTYSLISFPTIPREFCSEAERTRFLADVVDPLAERAAENAQRAAHFRAQVEAAINAYVQKDRPVPRELAALRRQAAADFAEQQRISDAIARFSRHVNDSKIVDCGPRDQSHGSIGVPVNPVPQIFGDPHSLRGQLYQASYLFAEALWRCDRAAMASALAQLERLRAEAKEQSSNSAVDPYLAQGTPEGDAAAETDALVGVSEDLVNRAKADLARDCPCMELPPAGTTVAQTGGNIGSGSGTAPGTTSAPPSKPTAPGTISATLPSTNPYGAYNGYPAPEPSPPLSFPLGPVDTKVYDPVSQSWVDYHNSLRREVGSLPLNWDPLLSAHAMDYAKALAETGQLRHSSREGRANERENIIIARHGSMSPLEMAHSWGKEKKLFHPGTFPNVCAGDWSKCAHYTQMIWSITTDMGCGFARGKRFDALVCRYSPPGNRDDKPVLVPAQQIVAQRPCPPGNPLTGRRP